ncbi:hypothetical protein OVY29_11085 [Sphingopyxis sp. SE2]|uniref:hypothetical protein n=1 Tax=Sphingopyxis sp. SE2 TaxID=1586240 RepID=UPI0028C0E81C|nr:hypothetical protein [Sphingopyxis sp. SE2]MDT7529208.1 hypothetical protein [Sphingopyxis sp. SE2]
MPIIATATMGAADRLFDALRALRISAEHQSSPRISRSFLAAAVPRRTRAPVRRIAADAPARRDAARSLFAGRGVFHQYELLARVSPTISAGMLTAQDRNCRGSHITVQNKIRRGQGAARCLASAGV